MTDWAERIDAYRLVPRVLVAGYGVLFYHVAVWYMTLPDPTTEQSAFIATIVGAAAVMFKFYTETGRKWR